MVTEPAVAASPFDEAARVLATAEEVALACHVNPDPDAIGSMLGLGLHLAGRGARVVASWGNEPFIRPPFLAALPGDGLIVPPAEFPRAPAVFVAFDTASAERLGALTGALRRAGISICLDHHVTNPGFGTIDVIDHHASSTAELAYRIAGAIGGDLSPDAAACLYAGILTDTGRFQYEAATPDTLRVAAALRDTGFDHVRLGQALFEDNTVRFLRVTRAALDRLVLDEEADLIWTYLTQADLAEAGATSMDTDDLIDVVRTAREADVACIVKQQRDGRFKVSLRSRGGHDVGAVAAAFGGGGHRLAAGYTSQSGPEETVRALASELRSHGIAGGSGGIPREPPRAR